MNLQIAKWGNSLALRIPADVARQFDLHAGDTVDARLTADGALSIRQGSWNRAAFASENEVARDLLPLRTAVINEMRQASRYWPVVYVDTSVLVALLAHESSGASVSRWYAATKAELVSATWCVTEFASALGIKQRMGQMNGDHAHAVWERFGRLVANDVKWLPLVAADFHRAATLTLDAASSLRAGDALHLACAIQAGAKSIATLDNALLRNAQRLKIKAVVFTWHVCVTGLRDAFAQ